MFVIWELFQILSFDNHHFWRQPGRPKGSLNRKTIARIYLSYLQEEVNPLTGIKELLSNEDMITFIIHKAKKGDVNAYKALMGSAYGAVKQSLKLTESEQPIFKQLDIDIIEL